MPDTIASAAASEPGAAGSDGVAAAVARALVTGGVVGAPGPVPGAHNGSRIPVRDVVKVVFTGTHGTVSDATCSGLMLRRFVGLPVGTDCTGGLTVVGVDDATGA